MTALRLTLRLVVRACSCIALGGAAHAGTMSLAWDPVNHPDLAGYRVYYDTTPGALAQNVDAGLSTSITIAGLEDCASYEVAVKAYDAASQESASFSNALTGWARPVVTSVQPAALEQQSQATLTLDGANFMQGAIVAFTDPSVTVQATGWASCHRLVIEVSIGAAALGPLAFHVINPDGVFGDGSGLLSIGADATPPAVTAVAVAALEATTATIGWSTSEPADGQVHFRRQGQSSWQASPVAAGLATTHAVALAGLWPGTSYQFYVESSDAAGNTATSAPAAFTTAAGSEQYLRFEAEAGALAGPIGVGQGAASFANAWIAVNGGTPTGVVTDPAGTSSYGFWLPSGGTWHIWVRVWGASQQSDSWFERVDGGSYAPFFTPVLGAWQWVQVRSYDLAAGQHTFTLGGREALARADRILVTSDEGFEPTELPGDDVTPPLPVTGLTALPASGQVTLGWVQPLDPDAARLVVRYRTDGVAPTSPVDGLSLVNTTTIPVGAASHLHGGLTNGTTYTYSVFVVDAEGNASTRATVTTAPAAAPPPEVDNLHRTDTL